MRIGESEFVSESCDVGVSDCDRIAVPVSVSDSERCAESEKVALRCAVGVNESECTAVPDLVGEMGMHVVATSSKCVQPSVDSSGTCVLASS